MDTLKDREVQENERDAKPAVELPVGDTVRLKELARERGFDSAIVDRVAARCYLPYQTK